MSLTLGAEPVPLERLEDGTIRIRGTRVPMDTVIYSFRQGFTAEEIAQQFPSLELVDIYGVIGFYLRHQPDVERYIEEREAQAAAIRQSNEKRFPPNGIRERLLARRNER